MLIFRDFIILNQIMIISIGSFFNEKHYHGARSKCLSPDIMAIFSHHIQFSACSVKISLPVPR